MLLLNTKVPSVAALHAGSEEKEPVFIPPSVLKLPTQRPPDFTCTSDPTFMGADTFPPGGA